MGAAAAADVFFVLLGAMDANGGDKGRRGVTPEGGGAAPSDRPTRALIHGAWRCLSMGL